MIRVMVSDVDGISLDINGMHERAWQFAFASLDIGCIRHEDYVHHILEGTADASRSYIIARVLSGSSPEGDLVALPAASELLGIANALCRSAALSFERLAKQGAIGYPDVALLLLQARTRGLSTAYASTVGDVGYALKTVRLSEILSRDDFRRYRLDSDASYLSLFDYGVTTGPSLASMPTKMHVDTSASKPYENVARHFRVDIEEIVSLVGSAEGISNAHASLTQCVGIKRNGGYAHMQPRQPGLLIDATNPYERKRMNLGYILDSIEGKAFSMN